MGTAVVAKIKLKQKTPQFVGFFVYRSSIQLGDKPYL